MSALDEKVQTKCATYESLHFAVALAEKWAIGRHLTERQQTILRDARLMLDSACQYKGETVAGRVADALMELATLLEEGS